jgi:hypoxanthine phosphoribosyltransferase
LEELKKQKPKSVFVVSLLFKKEALIENVEPDLFGFEVKNEFLLGYGLDYLQLGRNIKSIYKLI